MWKALVVSLETMLDQINPRNSDCCRWSATLVSQAATRARGSCVPIDPPPCAPLSEVWGRVQFKGDCGHVLIGLKSPFFVHPLLQLSLSFRVLDLFGELHTQFVSLMLIV